MTAEPARPDVVGMLARTEQLAQRPARQTHRPTPFALEPDDDDMANHHQGVRASLWQERIPSRFWWAQVSDLDPGAATTVAAWAANPRGANLCIFGPLGTGKTHAAVAALRILHDTGHEVRFFPLVELLDRLRPSGGDDGPSLYDLADIDVLAIDDLGAERPTDWTAERLYALVNRRWLEERPTIVTTNLEPDTMADAVGARTHSRLVGSGAVGVFLGGPDRRRT